MLLEAAAKWMHITSNKAVIFQDRALEAFVGKSSSVAVAGRNRHNASFLGSDYECP
jgi:hypothetical protein